MTELSTRLITGGRVFTADPDNPWAQAVVVRGESIAFVGDTSAATVPVHVDPTRTGMIKEGLAADLVVLTRDPLADGPSALLETEIAMTLANGGVIYE
jgi:predicted amidohydrolase YtcJ